MRELDLIIHGKSYRVACGDDEEDHLRRIAQDFDERVKNLRRNMGNNTEKMGEAHLILLAALLLADELDEVRRQLTVAEQALAARPAANPDHKESDFEQRVSVALAEVSARLESLAARLDQG
ncbi:MAG: cell division protein ZapA [Candidatus Symbiobacter sp.]|nr:cell division protein ZapA [Candidatus Symbiobacter sp.]